jgi:hypothetical protein
LFVLKLRESKEVAMPLLSSQLWGVVLEAQKLSQVSSK